MTFPRIMSALPAEPFGTRGGRSFPGAAASGCTHDFTPPRIYGEAAQLFEPPPRGGKVRASVLMAGRRGTHSLDRRPHKDPKSSVDLMPRTKDTPKTGKRSGNRYRKAAAPQGAKRSPRSAASSRRRSAKSRKWTGAFFPPLAAVWLIAVVVLSGLIFWGIESSRKKSSLRVADSSPVVQPKTTAEPPPIPYQPRAKASGASSNGPTERRLAQTESQPTPSAAPKAVGAPPTDVRTDKRPQHQRSDSTAILKPGPAESEKAVQVESPREPKSVPVSKPPSVHSKLPDNASQPPSSHEARRLKALADSRATIAPIPKPPGAGENGGDTAGSGAQKPAIQNRPPKSDSPSIAAPERKGEDRTVLAALHPDAAVRDAIPKPAPPPVELKPPIGRVAIVIDDFGQDLKMAKRFLEIPLPITFAVLPHQRHSREIARLAHARGREVLLHVPMEPQGYPVVNPGRGALLLSMSDESIQKSLHTALDTSPYFKGVNNHMGSRFTENEPRMELVLGEIARRGMFFLDSHTTASSVAVPVAQKLLVPTGRRDIFLDHVQTEEFVRSQLNQLIARAKTTGSAIAIGHPYECTLKVLREDPERFSRERIAVVPCGELMTNSLRTVNR